MGIQTEMIRIPGAQLCLIDGEESVHMQSGDFALSLLKQTHSPLAVVVANVGEVQWPVGKDAPVLKVWTRRYTFALPGLVYGLILPDTTSNIVLQQLENILARYCAFQIHHEIANSGMVIKLHPSCSPDLYPSPYFRMMNFGGSLATEWRSSSWLMDLAPCSVITWFLKFLCSEKLTLFWSLSLNNLIRCACFCYFRSCSQYGDGEGGA